MSTWMIVITALATWAILREIEVLIRHLIRRRRDKRSYRLWRARRRVALTSHHRRAKVAAEEAARQQARRG